MNSFLVTGGLACALVAGFVQAPVEPYDSAAELVVMVEQSDSSGDLVLAQSETGVRRDLTSGPERDLQPSWSPTGTEIAFVRESDDDSGIWIVDLDGEERRVTSRSTGRGAVLYPAWSPGGTRIAFTENGDVVVADLVTGESERLTNGPGIDYDPSWSPDGTQLVFVREQRFPDDTSRSDLFVVGVSPGHEERQLTSDGRAASPDWSPAGQLIAYDDQADVRVVSPAGGPSRSVAPGRFPAWAPDGRRLAFGGLEGSSDQVRDLVIHELADGTSTQVLRRPEGYLSDISWSPDGTQLTFYDQAGQEVVGVDRDGTSQRVLSAPGGVRDPEWGPGASIRTAGATRTATASELARTEFDSATTVVIASAGTYADALAGAPLARSLGAPVLLTYAERLGDDAAREVRRLRPEEAVVLGGRDALSPQVERDLRGLGVQGVRRIAGTDRFETAALVARELAPADEAYLVQGIARDPARGWPDAVAVAPVAAARGLPVVLTASDELPEVSRQVFESLDLTSVTIVGGASAVGPEVEAELRQAGIEVRERLAGSDRFATSAAVAEHALSFGASPSSVWLATGRNWPDAVAAGSAVASAGGVLLLTPDAFDDEATCRWVEQRSTQVARVRLLGGPDVVPADVQQAVERVVGGQSC